LDGATLTPTVIAISGRIGSGKSTLALELSRILGWSHASFGGFVRSLARERGWNEEREGLQALGEALIEQGWDEFTRAVLNHGGWKTGEPVVIDGVRHAEALESLCRVIGVSQVFHVHISISSDRLERRRTENRLGDFNYPGRMENHSTELQVLEVLPPVADMVVEFEGSAKELAAAVIVKAGLSPA
jgi:hypothetical protein